MRVTIIGTGAMACLFGNRLAPHAEVTLLGSWPAAIQAIRRDGIRLRTEDGESTARVGATDRPGECAGADLLLFLVKSGQTKSAAEQCASLLQADGLALTLQNGLGNKEILARVFGDARAAAGVATLGAFLEAPGVVRLGGEGEITLEDHPRIGPVRGLLSRAFPSVRVAQDLASLQWGKLVVNSGLNTLTALMGVPNGRLAEPGPLREAYCLIVEESAAIATALEIRLPYPDAKNMAIDVAMRTSGNRSSMLQDFSRGAEPELDAITGAVLEAADRCGAPAPLNRLMYQLVRGASSLRAAGKETP